MKLIEFLKEEINKSLKKSRKQTNNGRKLKIPLMKAKKLKEKPPERCRK